jgi:cytochrome P450
LPFSAHRLTRPSAEWREIHLDSDAAEIIARLSTRIFMPPLVHNEEWLKIAVSYTIDFFTGAYVLRMIPPILRPFAHWVLPFTRRLRAEVAAARRLILPIIEERKRKAAIGEGAGRTPEKYEDAIQWVETISQTKGMKCDPVYAQLNYTLGAVHTTSITFVNIVYDLIAHPEYQDLLREEITVVQREDPLWSKSSLAKLKLMDSFMKESTRLSPTTMCEYSFFFSYSGCESRRLRCG